MFPAAADATSHRLVAAVRGRRALAALALAATTAALPACARNPVTGQRELALISEAQEIQMGREAAQQAERSLGLVQDDAIQQYVQRVGAKLAGDSERPGLPWTFRVVDDASPNAFALPGGFIFVTRGMMNLMTNEAELASVIGHEIGHVTARHSVQQMSRGQLAELGLGIGSIVAPELTQPLTNAIVGRGPYLARIDGLVYGENPRNGFFEGASFIHPDLRFQLQMPRGWQAQNLPEAVVAVSPQQDAMFQLTLAQGANPATAARQFLAQQGVQAGQAFQQSINGIPAAGSYFQAQTEQGVVQGLAAFFTYNGSTYQLLSYATADRFASYDPTVRATIASFRALTDPKLLNIQPRRMDIVTLDRAQSLTALARSQGSTLAPAELAILNGVANPDTQLERGLAVKIVK